MAYTPSVGVFVDGEIIDAIDFTNEFALISTGMAQDVSDLTAADAVNLQAAKDYTDAELAAFDVDGGTF